MPKPVKNRTTKAKKRPSSDPISRIKQLQAEHEGKVAGAAPPWADTGTIDIEGRFTPDPPGRSVMEPASFAEQFSAHMRALGSKGGKIGGKRRLETLTQTRRNEIALKAARARWENRKPKAD